MDFPTEIPTSPEWIILYFFALAGFIFFVAAIVDILTGRFKNHGDKVRWFFIVFLFNIFGAALYFSIGRKKRWRK